MGEGCLQPCKIIVVIFAKLLYLIDYMHHFLHTSWKNLVRICKIVQFRIQNDLCFLRASALTFQSVLSIVPVLAVMFGIAKGFGVERLLENTLRQEFHDQQEIVSYYIQFGYTLLAQAQGGIIAGIGILILLITVMRLFSNIEDSFNFMCGVRTGRSLIRKSTDYLALILICPILIVASSSITVFLTTNLQKITAPGGAAEQFGPIAISLIQMIPYLMSALLFTLVYIVMPNTKVRFLPALSAGAFAGWTYQVLQATYISIQIKVSNAGAIYGSFAALPLFLMWLYLSWFLFLIGGQVMVILQERLWDPKILVPYRKLSPFEKELTALSCIKLTVDSFLQGNLISLRQLASALHMPEREVTQIIDELIEAGLVYKMALEEKTGYAIAPAKSPDTLRLIEVLSLANGTNALKSAPIKHFEELLRQAEKTMASSEKNPRLVDIKLN
jgi:membrane protein